jgi:peptidoglycan/xylan/chitin deacetylase (PgdA/CDA1 family)
MTVIATYLRLLARCMWVRILSWSGCLRWAERRLRDSGAIVTLTFHRVLDDASYRTTNSLPGIVIRERTFRELLRYVGDRYEPVVLTDAVPGAPSGAIRIAITFDDGWRDNYTIALPIVSAHRMPITVFVCPAVLGQEMPFWPERAAALLRATRPNAGPDQFTDEIEALKQSTPEKREQYFAALREQARNRHSPVEPSFVDRTLSWGEITEMDKAGVCFGSHTDTHQILTAGPANLAREEVRQSRDVLERTLGKPCQAFAYPNGNWSPETRQIVDEIGFTRAVTTQRGAWTSVSDSLAIPRSNVSESNVVGLTGRFWPAMFQYTALWKAWRATAHSARIAPALSKASSEQSVPSAAPRRADSGVVR